VLLDKSAEAWRNDVSAFSSSPVMVGDRIYQVTKTGELAAVDANTGNRAWTHRVGRDQLHASPTYGDGKLYLPMQSGDFYILRPEASGVKELAHVKLPGSCLGAPAIANGRIYVFTTERLYCFGSKSGTPAAAQLAPAASAAPKPGTAVALQVIPSEVLLQPGEKARFRVRGIDANGFVTGTIPVDQVKWASFIPPTAAVRAEMDGTFNAQGELVAGARASAGAFEATANGLKGYTRGRVVPAPPRKEDFEAADINVPHTLEQGVKFAYPPLPWIGARFRWEVREVDGSKALAKTLDNPLFQRAITFMGHPSRKNYTVEADVMSDGNRRVMSSVGVINQRYIVSLLGNAQQLEVTSNNERLKVAVPFAWTPKKWYRLKTRVDVAPDGNGVIRAKAWPRGEAEPSSWTIEVPHKQAHTHGSPGLYGFSPQSLFRVYVDNVAITPNS
jgi:outer membrane protein assembly factor BamB